MDFNDWEILFDVSEVDFESLSVFDEALFNPRNDNRSEASSDSSSYMSWPTRLLENTSLLNSSLP